MSVVKKMLEMKHHGLKLFGKDIALSRHDIGCDNISTKASDHIRSLKVYNVDSIDCHYRCTSSNYDSKQGENRGTHEKTWLLQSKKRSNSTITYDTKPASNDTEHSSSQHSNNKDNISDQTSSNNNTQNKKPLKKPNKILPCPRCNSMNTKFCYFNNYNVNQPRHFCKKCQRYWTAGGTMRNIPVGAGKRKSKNSSRTQHHHLYLQKTPCFPGLLGIPMPFCSVEVSNSSIWNTIQMKKEKNSHLVKPIIAKGGFFGGLDKFDDDGFRGKINPNNEELSMVLELNPAAYSRSLKFQEIGR